jgi:hypothetical protein
LLLEFETLAREAGWVCNDVEEVGSGDFRQTFAELAYQMLLSMSRRERMRARATAATKPGSVAWTSRRRASASTSGGSRSDATASRRRGPA